MTRTELSNLIAVSSTRLGYALRKLRDLGHITTNPTTRDGRQRPYYLSDPARKIIDDSSVQIRTWLDSGPTITRYSLRHPIEPASHATDSM